MHFFPRSFDEFEVNASAADAFDLVADLRNAAVWDPRTRTATKDTDGPIGLGTRYTLIGGIAGLRLRLPYEIIEYDRPNRLVVRGVTGWSEYREQVDFTRSDGGTLVTYDARLRLRGLLFAANPVMALMYQRIGDEATAGIARALNLAS